MHTTLPKATLSQRPQERTSVLNDLTTLRETTGTIEERGYKGVYYWIKHLLSIWDRVQGHVVLLWVHAVWKWKRRSSLSILIDFYPGGKRTELANARIGKDIAGSLIWLCVLQCFCFCLCSDVFMKRSCVCLASSQSQAEVWNCLCSSREHCGLALRSGPAPTWQLSGATFFALT